jgi:shikimate dehydrogenase
VQRLPIIGQFSGPSFVEAVQQAAFAAAGVEIEIDRWDRKPHQLADAITALKAGDYIGALIAAPHKERASTLVGTLSDDAKQSGAVSVVVRDGQRLRGYNADVDGVRAGLVSILPKVQGKWPRQAVVLGAGGGARAVVSVLIGSGFQRIAVFNRHLHRAEALVSHFARSARHMDLRAMPWHETIIAAELSKAGLLVNTTAIGIAADENPIEADALPSDLHVLDLVLDHAVTPLMRQAKERGGTVSNGQLSFLRASAETFRLLTGQEAPESVMRETLAAELGMPSEGVAVVVGD